MTTAQRVQAYRVRQRERIMAAEAEAAALRLTAGCVAGDLAAAEAEIERLGAELASGPVPRCPRCAGELACPACYRSGDDF